MPKVYLICGKICSGKSRYARLIRENVGAVILSTDEVTWDLIENEQGEFYDAFAQRVNLYLRKKTVEIVGAGANVILDWGFWTKSEREKMREFFLEKQIPVSFYYLDISDDVWKKRIAKRNLDVQNGKTDEYYIDENLAEKFRLRFEKPDKEEIDVWLA